MHHLTTAASLFALASGISAQEFTDTFSAPTVPNQPPVLGWTVHSGVWAVQNGRLQTNGDKSWAYVTKDGIAAQNCVLDMEAFFNPNGGIQFCGLAARFTSISSTILCKIQQNSTASAAFDRAFIYELGGGAGSTWQNTTSTVQSAYCRMVVVGTECWMSLDLDKDGIYDQTIGPRVLTTLTGGGQIGLNVFHMSQIDNFEYFNAVLKPAANATPKIGTTYDLELHSSATKTVPWRMALSTGNKGFPIGKRRIPLDPDPVFDLSLLASGTMGLEGVTDANGTAKIGFRIPNVTALIGNTLFGAAITIDFTRPLAIDNISNEISIRFH